MTTADDGHDTPITARPPAPLATDPATSDARHLIISMAITLLRNSNPAALAPILAATDIHDSLKADPPALADLLADPPNTPSAYRAAGQIILALTAAAGLTA